MVVEVVVAEVVVVVVVVVVVFLFLVRKGTRVTIPAIEIIHLLRPFRVGAWQKPKSGRVRSRKGRVWVYARVFSICAPELQNMFKDIFYNF